MTHKLPDDSFHFHLKNKRGYPLTPEVGISVGKKISCPTCNSEKISIFFKPGFSGNLIQEWSDFMEKNDFELCSDITVIVKYDFNPNWICKNCYECGVIINEN